MATLKEIRKNLKFISTIKTFATAYYEITNLRMKKIKERVLKNRQFYQELLKTFERIKGAYLMSFGGKKREKKFLRVTKKGIVVVFLSANEFFYGTLILDIWKEVKKFLEGEKADLVVVGKVGKYLAESAKISSEIFYFDLDDVNPEKEKIALILGFIKNYERVIVFHGRYERGLVQKPTLSEISGSLPMGEKEKKYEKYLFEPSPEAVLEFFETELVGVLLNIAILEHQLAKYAARVMVMHQAIEKAKELEKKFLILENKLKRELANKRQIELFGGLEI